jgi:hypothetical protein
MRSLYVCEHARDATARDGELVIEPSSCAGQTGKPTILWLTTAWHPARTHGTAMDDFSGMSALSLR